MIASKVADQRPKSYREKLAEREARRKRAGKNIRAIRQGEALSTTAFGKSIGATHTAVQKWENGESIPCDQFLIAIHRLYDAPLAYLHGLEGATRQEQAPVTLASGERLTDDQLNEALTVRLATALTARLRANVKAVRFLRQAVPRGRVSAAHVDAAHGHSRNVGQLRPDIVTVADASRFVPAPADPAIAALVRIVEQSAEIFYRNGTPNRVERHAATHGLGPRDAALVRLGASLAEAELEFVRNPVATERNLRFDRQAVWQEFKSRRAKLYASHSD